MYGRMACYSAVRCWGDQLRRRLTCMLEIARECSPQQVPFNRSFFRFLYRCPLTFYSRRNAFGYGT